MKILLNHNSNSTFSKSFYLGVKCLLQLFKNNIC